MYVYLLATSAGSEYHKAESASQEEIAVARAAIDAVMPGLRTAFVLPDFIIGGKGFPGNAVTSGLAERFKSCAYFALFDELAPDVPMKSVDKILNKFIGKEKVLVVVSQEMWVAILRHMVGDDAIEPDFAPGMLTLAELYVKKFPGPGAATLNFVRSAVELSA